MYKVLNYTQNRVLEVRIGAYFTLLGLGALV